MDGCPSFLGWLSALLVTSFLTPLLLQPLLPSARAEPLSELTASARKLDRLFQAERDIVQELETFVQLSQSQLEFAKRYLETYRAHNPVQQPSNPVRDYKLMQRIEQLWTRELHEPELLLTLSAVQRRAAEFVDSKTGSGPGKPEAMETLQAMLDVQVVYDLDVSELADGKLMGLDTGTKMSVDDLVKLAGVLCSSNFIDRCLVWLEGAVQVAVARNETEWVGNAVRNLKQFIEKHDVLLGEGGAPGIRLFPSAIGDRSPRAMQSELERRITLSDQGLAINKLCRGTELRDVTQLSKLFCKYERLHPYLYLQPLKTEVQSLDPYLCIYHDILHKSEMDKIINIAHPYIRRSKIGTTERVKLSGSRVSSDARLQDSADPVVVALNRRIEIATGLDVTNRTGYQQESLQVAEYGTGGQYVAHHDYLNLADEAVRREFKDKAAETFMLGERVATIMFYLSPVLRGGRTVFPLLGVTVEPEAGSAVYWDNLLPDGTPDERTVHTGCPVAFGYKWIANKFIREMSQTFRKPCRKANKRDRWIEDLGF